VSYGLRLQPEARDDIREARRWYDGQRAGLGREFVEEVQTVLGAIRDNPARFTPIYRHFRRALLNRFPYGIVFAVAGDTVQVVACLHVRRDPDTWLDRV
jgi:plasmid stabilization system protein ParE